jgi:hypothetical protein
MTASLFDETTGEVREGACPSCTRAITERVQAEADLQAAERELRKARREITRLKKEVHKQRTESPEGYRAKAIFKYWVKRCEKDPKRTVFGEKRMEKVLAQLKHHEPSYIARAIDGLAVGAYVNTQGHKYDDLELVCRDEVHLERFYSLAERVGAPTLAGPAWIAEFEGQPLGEQDAIF